EDAGKILVLTAEDLAHVLGERPRRDVGDAKLHAVWPVFRERKDAQAEAVVRDGARARDDRWAFVHDGAGANGRAEHLALVADAEGVASVVDHAAVRRSAKQVPRH